MSLSPVEVLTTGLLVLLVSWTPLGTLPVCLAIARHCHLHASLANISCHSVAGAVSKSADSSGHALEGGGQGGRVLAYGVNRGL